MHSSMLAEGTGAAPHGGHFEAERLACLKISREESFASKRLMLGWSLKHGLRRSSQFCVSAGRSATFSHEFRIEPSLIGVFCAVDRRNVRWIFIQIGSADPKFLAVGVDPLPQGLI
jgi:hypothetical protein